jgi:glycosyltransferase involved in cell wall biosynthesis
MKIGIDGRLWSETGVGRYIRNLVTELARIDDKNTYIVFLTKKGYDAFTPPNERWHKRIADVRWHTVKEQIVLPYIFGREHLDVLHVPYFNVPVLYPGRVVVTTHDLTILHFRTGRATTLPPWMYALRRLGYSIIFSAGIRRAKKIFAVSKTTKADILSNFHVDQKKIIVTYEGVDNLFVSDTHRSDRRPINGTYLLYVGNAYPHKNLETLLEAFDRLVKVRSNIEIKLVFVGKDDHFTKRLKERTQRLASSRSVIFFGEAHDDELGGLYRHARAFVFPSLAEGFGLPAIEAVAFGCPVVCSDIPIFHEIVGDKGTYFDPTDVQDIVRALDGVLKITKKPAPFLDGRFSWREMAEKTLHAYEDCICV